jgi:hypothetical protein
MKENENSVVDSAKERVEVELEELKEKIVKLSAFLYDKKLFEIGLSDRMIACLQDQLKVMQQYARVLQIRLVIWGKNDDEIVALTAGKKL